MSVTLVMSLGISTPSIEAMESHSGVLYSYKNDAIAPICSWSFWLLHKSKKVWFKLDERYWGMNIEPFFFYKGQRIIYRGDLRALPIEERNTLETTAIQWGQHVSNGWGHGPEGTNYYLNLWTRWSIFQPASCNPEFFSITYRLPNHH
jgi:hypothetical protein